MSYSPWRCIAHLRKPDRYSHKKVLLDSRACQHAAVCDGDGQGLEPTEYLPSSLVSSLGHDLELPVQYSAKSHASSFDARHKVELLAKPQVLLQQRSVAGSQTAPCTNLQALRKRIQRSEAWTLPALSCCAYC